MLGHSDGLEIIVPALEELTVERRRHINEQLS